MANSGNTTQQKNWKKVMCIVLSVIMAFGTFLSMTVGSLFLSDHFGVKTAYAAENDVNAPHFYRYNELVGLYKTNYQNEEKLQYKIGEDGEWSEYKLPFTIPAFETTRVYARVGENGTIVYDDLTVMGEALGVYTESNTDFELSYKSITYEYMRSYNSFENKWFDSINSCAKVTDGRMEVVLPDSSKSILVQIRETTYKDELTGFTATIENENCIFDNGNYKYFFKLNRQYTLAALCAIEDKFGNRLELVEKSDLISYSISDDKGRSFSIDEYYDMGNPNYDYCLCRKITDPNGNVLNYILNPELDPFVYIDRYELVTDQADVIIGEYAYDKNDDEHRLIRSMDKNISYYDNGRLKEIRYDDGSYIKYNYDDENMLFTTFSSNGATTKTVYNDAFMPVSYTDESGTTTTYTYDEYYRFLTETTANETTTYTYDEAGNILSWVTENSDNNAYFTYNSVGQCIRTQQGEDYTYYTYDDNGNVLICATLKSDYKGEIPSEYNSSLDCFEVTTYTYAPDGSVVKEENPFGDTMEYEYDKYGNALKETCNELEEQSSTVTTYTYDTLGNVLTIDYKDDTSVYIYDEAGRILLENENGKCTRTLYDEYGRVVQKIASEDYKASLDGLPVSNTYSNSNVGQRYFYNDKNQVIKEINRLNVVTEYEYYPTGEKASESFDIYEYYYNINGLVTDVYVEHENAVSYSYDDNNNLVLESYANGQSIRYKYDNDNNLTAQYHNCNATAYVTYTYNAENELTEKVNTDTGLKYIYGENGHVSIYKLIDNSLVQSYTENVIETDETAGIPEYTTITENHFGTEYTSVIKDSSVLYTFNENAVLYNSNLDDEYRLSDESISFNDENKIVSIYDYDDNNNITDKQVCYDGIDFDFNNVYDNENKIVSSTFFDGYIDYSYDAEGQLEQAIGDYHSAIYAYDNRGNSAGKIFVCDELGIVEYKEFNYNDAYYSDHLTSITDNLNSTEDELVYDEVGNLIYCNDTQFGWGSGRNLEYISSNEMLCEYTYDENGIRTSKNVNGIITDYNTIDGVIISQQDNNNTIYFQYDLNGVPIGFICNGEQYFYITNQMGDIMGITDCNDSEIAHYVYDAWGKVITIYGDEQIASINPLRYRGYYYDNETGFYYLQSRYYNPDWCRFINADFSVIPLQLKDSHIGINLFSYCENAPANSIDIHGVWAEDVHNGYNSSKKNHYYTASFKNDTVYYGTYYWAKSLGFSESQARIIGDSCNMLDTICSPVAYGTSLVLKVILTLMFIFVPIPLDTYYQWQGYHFNLNSFGTDSRTIYAESQLDLAIKAWKKSLNYKSDSTQRKYYQKLALTELGYGLHSIQDIEAHGNIGKGEQIPHHLSYDARNQRYADNIMYDWSNPLRITLRYTKIGERITFTKNETIHYLNRFIKKIGGI